jgi:hypothetical protein
LVESWLRSRKIDILTYAATLGKILSGVRVTVEGGGDLCVWVKLALPLEGRAVAFGISLT